MWRGILQGSHRYYSTNFPDNPDFGCLKTIWFSRHSPVKYTIFPDKLFDGYFFLITKKGFHLHLTTFLRENVEFQCSEILQNIFTMVEENFEFSCFEMLSELKISTTFSQNIFTMVEENFEFLCSEIYLFRVENNQEKKLVREGCVKFQTNPDKIVIKFKKYRQTQTNQDNSRFFGKSRLFQTLWEPCHGWSKLQDLF